MSPFANKTSYTSAAHQMFWRRPECAENPIIAPLPSSGTPPLFRESKRDAVQIFRKNGTKKRIYATNTGPLEPLRGHILFSPGTIFIYKKDTIIFNKLQHDFNNYFNNLLKLYTAFCICKYCRRIYGYIIKHYSHNSNPKKHGGYSSGDSLETGDGSVSPNRPPSLLLQFNLCLFLQEQGTAHTSRNSPVFFPQDFHPDRASRLPEAAG